MEILVVGFIALGVGVSVGAWLGVRAADDVRAPDFQRASNPLPTPSQPLTTAEKEANARNLARLYASEREASLRGGEPAQIIKIVAAGYPGASDE